MTTYTKHDLDLEAKRMLLEVRKANKGNGKTYCLEAFNPWQLGLAGPNEPGCTHLAVNIKDSDGWVQQRHIAI